MDFLNMLSGLLTSSSSVDALSAKTGTDSSQTKGILGTALPLLFGALTNNTKSEEGAASLLGALKQHTNTETLEDQIKNADAEDGNKIIQHILGKNQKDVVQSISEKTGADVSQINSLLSNLAPGLMSSLSAATNEASKKIAREKAATGAKLARNAKVVKANADAGAKLAGINAHIASESMKQAKEAAKEVAKEEVEAVQDAGLDLSGLLGLFGGGGDDGKESGGGLGSLLGGLFGGSGDSGESSSPLMSVFKSIIK